MNIAFSDANPGWVSGDRYGLGSAHTPGPWTLGDVQAWTYARILGGGAAADAVLARLQEVAFADAMLPEAYGADDDARVRHWCAWPGAALAALRLLRDRWATPRAARCRGSPPLSGANSARVGSESRNGPYELGYRR